MYKSTFVIDNPELEGRSKVHHLSTRGDFPHMIDLLSLLFCLQPDRCIYEARHRSAGALQKALEEEEKNKTSAEQGAQNQHGPSGIGDGLSSSTTA